MQWLAEQLRGIRCLHQLAQVHHRDLIGEELHHRQVMGDKEIGQVELRLQILQQVQDLGLDGHVQRGHRLVADDELGLQGQRPGDAHPLAAAAVQLVGIGVEQPGGEAHHVHQPGNLLIQLRTALGLCVNPQRFPDDLPNGHPGVQGGERVLEDDLQILAQVVKLLLIHLADVLSVEQDLAAGGLVQA